MPTPPQAPVNVGDVLLGKYRVDRVLGAGGMGVVVAATHTDLGQRVAIKFLNKDVLATQEAVARFQREARAAAKIRSEHVARVIDVGRLESGSPYMIMEYLEGEDLSSVIARGPVPVEEAVDYVIQACDAMAEAHAEGIVHRDLKPANLFLMYRTDGSGVVKVLDFGISKVKEAELADQNLTHTRAVMGSPLYMSPEQMRSSRDVDRRTDVWSLGVILFELVAGKTPFTGQTFTDLVAAILTDPPADLATLQPDTPPSLVNAVARCLEKDPNRRFQNVGELAQAIVGLGSRQSRVTAERVLKVVGVVGGIESPVRVPPRAPLPVAEAASGGTGTAWAETRGGAPRSRSPVYVAAAALGAGALVGGWLLMRGPSPAESGPTVASAETASQAASAIPARATAEAAIVPAASVPLGVEPEIPAEPVPAKLPVVATAPPKPSPVKPKAVPRVTQPVAAPTPPAPTPPKPTAPARRGLNMDLK